MRYLRPLMLSILVRSCVLVLGFILNVFASTEAEVMLGGASLTGSRNKDILEPVDPSAILRESVSLRSDVFGNLIKGSIQLTQEQKGLELFRVRDEKGFESYPFQSASISSTQFTLGANGFLGPQMIWGNVSTGIGPDPFLKRLGQLGYERSFEEELTRMGVEFLWLNQRQPESYFVSVRSKLLPRPLALTTLRARIFVEKALSENWKTRLTVGVARRIEDRPPRWEGELRSVVAVTSRLFPFFEGGISRELKRGDPEINLLDERGYFNLWHFRAGLEAEPFYFFRIVLSYGQLYEIEEDPRILRKVQSATDQWALKAEWERGNYTLKADVGLEYENTDSRFVQVASGIAWRW